MQITLQLWSEAWKMQSRRAIRSAWTSHVCLILLLQTDRAFIGQSALTQRLWRSPFDPTDGKGGASLSTTTHQPGSKISVATRQIFDPYFPSDHTQATYDIAAKIACERDGLRTLPWLDRKDSSTALVVRGKGQWCLVLPSATREAFIVRLETDWFDYTKQQQLDSRLRCVALPHGNRASVF